jgi:hypothetical protein
VYLSDKGGQYLNNYISRLNATQQSLVPAYIELGRLDDALSLTDSVIRKLVEGAEGQAVDSYVLVRLDRLQKHEHWAQFWKGCILAMQSKHLEALNWLGKAYRPPVIGGRAIRLRPGATEEERRAMIRQLERTFAVDEDVADDNTRVDIMRFIMHLKLANRVEAVKHLATAFADNSTFFGPATPGIASIFTLESLPQEIPRTVPKNKQAFYYIAGISLFAANRKEEARVFLLQAIAEGPGWSYYLARTELAALDAGGSF